MRNTRLQRIITDVQYILTYGSGLVEDDVVDQIKELLTHEGITFRVDRVDDDFWTIDAGSYLLN